MTRERNNHSPHTNPGHREEETQYTFEGHFYVCRTGPDLQCLLKVKEDLSKVLIFQHAISNAK